MKNIKWAVMPLLIGIICFSGCVIIDDGNGIGRCVSGTGSIVTQTLDLDNFSEISLDIDADIFLTQGDEQEVIVEGKQNIIDELNLDVSSGEWRVKGDRCLKHLGNMKIFITIPNIEALSIHGSGDIRSENVLVSNHLNLSVSGSGDFDLAVDAESIDCNVSGSGDIYMEGATSDFNYKLSGSGDLNAFDLETHMMDVKISGSGDADVWVLDYLKVRIAGSGDIHYKGHPELDINISGSGHVVDAN